MYYLKVGFGVVMCFIGGWQLAGVLGEGDGTSGGGSGSMFSAESYEWTASCDRMAKRLFGSGSVGPVKMNGALLQLRQQGCNPDKAPSGTIPPVSDTGSGATREKQPNDWGGQGGRTQDAADGWGS